MANESLLNTPTLWINKYLEKKIPELTGLSDIPFFPTMPSTIDDLTEMFPSGEVFATYDRMFKMNRKNFPHIKNEQLLYYFYAVGSDPIIKVVKTTEAIFRLLDRLDESAEEINNWCSNRTIEVKDPTTNPTSTLSLDNIFYFHNFKVYQLEETRDIIDFGTARTYAGNKIIIDFEYHQKQSFGPDGKDQVAYSDWRPEKLASKEVIKP